MSLSDVSAARVDRINMPALNEAIRLALDTGHSLVVDTERGLRTCRCGERSAVLVAMHGVLWDAYEAQCRTCAARNLGNGRATGTALLPDLTSADVPTSLRLLIADVQAERTEHSLVCQEEEDACEQCASLAKLEARLIASAPVVQA